MYACPLCDDYEAPTAGGVKGHITASTSGDHKGRNGPEWSNEDLLESGDDAPDADEQDTAPDTAASGESSDEQSGRASGAQSPPQPDASGCPNCDAEETFDPSAGLREAGLEPGNHPEIAKYDHGCYECSTAEEWVVWNE